MYTMPTWSESELQFVSADIGAWYEDFTRFGGVPRYIFASPDHSRSSHILLDEALIGEGGALVETVFKFGMSSFGRQHSYMLLHVNPPVLADGSFDYNYSGMPVHTFASDYIFQRLMERHSAQMLAGAACMFNVKPAALVASETCHTGTVSAAKPSDKLLAASEIMY